MLIPEDKRKFTLNLPCEVVEEGMLNPQVNSSGENIIPLEVYTKQVLQGLQAKGGLYEVFNPAPSTYWQLEDNKLVCYISQSSNGQLSYLKVKEITNIKVVRYYKMILMITETWNTLDELAEEL